jgi:hypothetical protein
MGSRLRRHRNDRRRAADPHEFQGPAGACRIAEQIVPGVVAVLHPSGIRRAQHESQHEGWRRQQTRASFTTVLDAVRAPNLPIDNTHIVSYNPVEEAAHRVGRALHDINDPDLTTAVLADVEAELAAVEQAELGDLNGRARQPVLLTREDVSPVQVAAADQRLARHPLGTDDLFLHYDPTAAAVAAAH